MIQKRIAAELSRKLGPIRPLHGVGGGPVTANFRFDATAEFREAGIPFGRTHDIEYPYGCGEFVDIHCIFPWFKADVNDPESYNFALTDLYFKEMLSAGTKPFYRLGNTIEHQPIKRHIHPPADFEKWGEICSHIIAHYNEGWADGFHMGIEYWEIWNEPEIGPCWTGTHEQIFELYDKAAAIIKRDHPDVKVGGLAFTSPYAGIVEEWLSHLKVSGAPMDFLSWHGYIHKPEQAVDLSKKAEELLDKYGLSSAESIYDEWNYVMRWDKTIQRSIDLHKTPFGGAFCAAVIAALQGTRTDKAMFYDAQQETWNSLFAPGPMLTHGKRQGVISLPGYYALLGWNELYKAGTSVSVKADADLYAAAATDGKSLWVYVSYYNDDGGYGLTPPDTADVVFDIGQEYEGAEAFVSNSTCMYKHVPLEGNTLCMEGNSFALVRIPLKD